MNCSEFEAARNKIINSERQKNGIGTLGEKTLHAVLKNYYEPHQENHEIRVGGFVADIVGENGITEIQTGNFSKLTRKLEHFLEFCSVTVVYPIPAVKYLSWMDPLTGEIAGRRKSPRKGTIYDVMPELYRIKYTLDNPRMNLCLCMLEVEEIRYLNGWSRDRKKGSSRCDRIPLRITDEIYIRTPYDYNVFLPETLPEEFTSQDLAAHAGISRTLAQTTLNILSFLETADRCGKRGNNIIYRRK
ncbi:hypothetical protein [Ruminococcus sp. Marseille-P6503]|uniref:hypothetical protein n=1 Tax=Ruminococcus sp. Marseille-P6503 TaxID=2364796 RepID=UPI000F51B4FE|nr:hypothetical protein [Ruminococcus sp. Marseille-P6503]